MGTRNAQIDGYIERSAEFARPILTHLREVVHEACPEVEEALKWSTPHFTYRGMLCHMAAFKQHCAFGFWKGALIFGADAERDAMGHFGRITSLEDLPRREVLIGHIHQAMRLNEAGTQAPRPKREPRGEAEVPADLTAALESNPEARGTFEAFSASQRREYVDWIKEAKTDATRSRRLEQAVEWMAEGKTRNWKYARP